MNNLDEIYRQKYLKYKTKYLELKSDGGAFAKPKSMERYIYILNSSFFDSNTKIFGDNFKNTSILPSNKIQFTIFKALLKSFPGDAYVYNLNTVITDVKTTPTKITPTKITPTKTKTTATSFIIFNINKFDIYDKNIKNNSKYNDFLQKCNILQKETYYNHIDCNIIKPDYNSDILDINYENLIDNNRIKKEDMLNSQDQIKLRFNNILNDVNSKVKTPFDCVCLVEVSNGNIVKIYLSINTTESRQQPAPAPEQQTPAQEEA